MTDRPVLAPAHSRVSLATLMHPTEANLLGSPWHDASGRLLHVASAYFVFVAIDEDGNPRPVPALAPESPDEVRRMREAEIRRAHRLARKTEIDQGRGGPHG